MAKIKATNLRPRLLPGQQPKLHGGCRQCSASTLSGSLNIRQVQFWKNNITMQLHRGLYLPLNDGRDNEFWSQLSQSSQTFVGLVTVIPGTRGRGIQQHSSRRVKEQDHSTVSSNKPSLVNPSESQAFAPETNKQSRQVTTTHERLLQTISAGWLLQTNGSSPNMRLLSRSPGVDTEQGTRQDGFDKSGDVIVSQLVPLGGVRVPRALLVPLPTSRDRVQRQL